ncbi:MAG: leucine-rich repeat protein [Clostridia bacterium]|nr:leucine-rich repeat protein [Clostridia bacterium]
MKKLPAMILAMVLALSCSCAFAVPERTDFTAGEYDPARHVDIQPAVIGNYAYIILEDGTAEIVKYTGNTTELLVPGKFAGIRVTSIGREAFAGQTALTSVAIPEGVTHIGYSAFNECTALTSITLPDSLLVIDTLAFYKNTSLTHVELPGKLIRIGSVAFNRCESLTSVTIPASVVELGDNAFGMASEGKLCPTLIVTPGSVAEQYALDYWYRYFYSEGMTEAWTCPSCLNYNLANICAECGAAMPEPESAPVDDGSWTCTCGAKNTSKFCPECGSPRPAETAPVTDPECSGCGYRPEGDVPKFCPECGTKF